MKYRHSFHAGNFADVHKHVTLLASLRAMQRKDKGFLYLDSHAGRGSYDLAGADSHHGAEARHGVDALRSANPRGDEIRDYLQNVAAARAGEAGTHSYPGSPLLAAQVLRSQDRGICCELQPAECRALARTLAGWPRLQVECADGFRQLAALLPSRERRALVLMDPPYEDTATELRAALAAIVLCLQRQSGVVIVLWYPIKDERSIAPWLMRVAATISAPVLLSELWLHPRDSSVALNGSGLLVVNAPYQFDERMAEWLPELGELLGTGKQGGTAQRWLVSEAR